MHVCVCVVSVVVGEGKQTDYARVSLPNAPKQPTTHIKVVRHPHHRKTNYHVESRHFTNEKGRIVVSLHRLMERTILYYDDLYFYIYQERDKKDGRVYDECRIFFLLACCVCIGVCVTGMKLSNPKEAASLQKSWPPRNFPTPIRCPLNEGMDLAYRIQNQRPLSRDFLLVSSKCIGVVRGERMISRPYPGVTDDSSPAFTHPFHPVPRFPA
jgi:hypothetical protein